MKIRITKSGVYGAKGEIPVGTELDVKNEPKGWDGRYEVISPKAKARSAEAKTAIINPAQPATEPTKAE